ncbi:aldehyde dehydrogenase family protein [Paraburkholderia sp. 22B1P]|uniref:aldehyde dehydrogenase family protein n=1 Tax=Paraburkholderia sp. 22B1P TaxID=3080498 RepID=UPI00308F6C4B|nr:aldehyde dehydrogenase family protein [Paraburkholderia sp. 22B1P]
MTGYATAVSSNVRNRFFIDGEWVLSHADARHVLISPATEEPFMSVPLADSVDVDRAIAAARRAFDKGPWPKLSGAERSAYLKRLTEEIRQRLPVLAQLWTDQVGAPITFASGLLPTGITRFEFFASLAETFEFEDARPTRRGHARVRREPVGVAALIAPWNATFPIVAHKIAAALAAGCTLVVKSPLESPLDALIIAECAAAAGLPPGVLNVITAGRDEGAQLVQSRDVDKISFTGSVATGQWIARAAADRLARVTLELGGKSAAILLDDVDLPAALAALTPFTMPFSGQICFAQTRILAPRARHDEVVSAYAEIISKLKLGDPREADTRIGPVLNAVQRDRVRGYIERGIGEGARLVLGGTGNGGFERGYFVEPTVFADVTPHMTIAQQEIFGPVVSILPYDDIDDAVRIANDTPYGLSGSVYSRDVERAYAVACRVQSGHIGINGIELAANVPFGGFKLSGVGREGGREGLEAYLETKAVFMPTAAG